MKKIFINTTTSILSIILILSFASCSKEISENEVTEGSSQKIRITGVGANTITKTTLDGLITSWNAGDKVGIYSPDARPTASGAAGVTNRQFSAGTTAFSSAFTAITDNEMYWGTATPHRFYAYYPYSASAGSDATLVPVTLAAAQTQSAGNSSAHIGNYDFMVATPVTGATPGTAGEATTVNLRYNHVFSILEFQIINATGTISEIKLSGNGPLSLTSGTIDITQTTPVNAATTYTISSPVYGSEITLTTAAITTTADYVTTPKIYMMVLPKSITGYLDIAIKIGDEYKFIQKEITSGGFDRGQKYKVQIDASTATDYPGTTLAQVNIGGLYWAPVNAGYITTIRPYGLMYQWGRKYGQEYVGTGTVAGPVAISVGNNPANVANFYTNNNSPWDWCAPQVTSWTTTYTPCPAGWRVPTAVEMTALNTAGSSWVAAAGGNPDGLAGRWFGSTSDSPTTVKNIFLPAAGMRTNHDGALNSRDSYGSYWSSQKNSGTTTHADNLEFYSSGSASMSVSGGAYGMTVRCVKTLTGS